MSFEDSPLLSRNRGLASSQCRVISTNPMAGKLRTSSLIKGT